MATKTKTKEQNPTEEELTEMLENGLHFGNKKSRWNPAMEPYIHGLRNGIHIIDLEKTYKKLQEALNYLAKMAREDKTVLFVGTAVEMKEIIKETAEELDQPYVIGRWIGGTLTNFDVIEERLEYFRDLEERKEKGELEKYPKIEQREFDRELERLEQKWGGVKEIDSLPDCLFVADYKGNELAVKEARDMDIPIVSVCDTDGDPASVDYPIPANTDAIKSVRYILEQIRAEMKKNEAGPEDEEK